MRTLQWIRVTFRTVASCEDCEWRCDLDATRAAKRHATENPGHAAITERKERGLYWLPADEGSKP